MNLQEALQKLDALQRKMAAYRHASGLIYYDGVTGAPSGSAQNRAETLAILSEADYELSCGAETAALLDFLSAREEEMTAAQRRMTELLRRDLDELRRIPPREYVAREKLISEADAVWHEAKPESDFALFAPYLERLVETQIRFAGYCRPDMNAYDYWLDRYEPGLTRDKCDDFFAALRARLVPLLRRVQAAPQVDASFLAGNFPLEKQRALSDDLMNLLGIDRAHCALAETEHPFTTSFTKYDARITTHYYPDNFVSSLFSVIHEGGHALYDMNVRDETAYTCLGEGVSMGVHESQSRFFENLIGRSRSFLAFLAPRLRALFPQLEGVSDGALYRAVNRCEAGLIRIEADELTYCLHVMVRYELERALFAGEVAVRDLPEKWNALYRQYLGVTPKCDREGVLQDSHWAGGSFGYFPSYALGSAYGAQLMDKMRETVPVDECLSRGDLAPVSAWLRESIWQYGSLYKPRELLERAFGAPFDPSHYLDYLEKKFSEIYSL